MIARQWEEIELHFEAEQGHEAPYVSVEAWTVFRHSNGLELRRPAFWDGGRNWRVRFTSPLDSGTWEWRSFANVSDAGLVGRSGSFEAGPSKSGNRYHRHGLLKMSPGARSVIHADGKPWLMVADTIWSIPFRATHEMCREVAADRQQKGFNSVLMMTVQPDRDARGPRARNVYEGFEIGFEDLSDGHINQLVPEYFQYFDQLVDILLEHEIVPIYQPVFHGFGFKGLKAMGGRVPVEEYVRYCRYLVARYGARPAIWLIGGDGKNDNPGIAPAGEDVEEWDAYGQPTGLHYCPHGSNNQHQSAEWLDFQWCQTGHSGDHRQDKVAEMWRDLPPKGVANGESTYERLGHPDKAVGWWQGHEAWMNLMSGGTMGVVYGAGSMWQLRVDKHEPGFSPWTQAADYGWREAMQFDGSRYVGLIGKMLDGLPTTDLEKRDDYSFGNLVAAAGDQLAIVYLANGGGFDFIASALPRDFKIYDPRTAEVLERGRLEEGKTRIELPFGEPRLVIFADLAGAV